MDAAQRSSSFPSFFKVPCIFLHNDYAFNVFVILVSSLTQNIREIISEFIFFMKVLKKRRARIVA